MSSTEVSLDAPIDRSDREASTLGERFAGVDGTEIEDTTDYKLMKEFIEAGLPEVSHASRAEDPLPLLWARRERRADDARERSAR